MAQRLAVARGARAPVGEQPQRARELASALRELVDEARRALRVRARDDERLLGERLQPRAEDVGRDPAELLGELVEALRAPRAARRPSAASSGRRRARAASASGEAGASAGGVPMPSSTSRYGSDLQVASRPVAGDRRMSFLDELQTTHRRRPRARRPVGGRPRPRLGPRLRRRRRRAPRAHQRARAARRRGGGRARRRGRARPRRGRRPRPRRRGHRGRHRRRAAGRAGTPARRASRPACPSSRSPTPAAAACACRSAS